MTLAKDRLRNRYVHPDGLVVKPATLAGAELLPDGQVVPTTDQVGVNLMVRKGGSLVPTITPYGARSETKEWMTWTVDYATGTSPPDGTIITTQAEFDALGAPLKFLQDVERVRPQWVNHAVRVHVLAGDQWAMPSQYRKFVSGVGDMHANFIATPFMSSRNITQDGDKRATWIADGAPTNTAFLIYGDIQKEETGIAGTWSQAADSQYTFTRTAGTWTAGALEGKFVLLATGPLAGSRMPVTSNDTTSFTVPGSVGTGAATVDTEIMATRLRGKTVTGARGYAILLWPGPRFNQLPSIQYRFQWLDIDEGDDSQGLCLLSQGCAFYYCRFRSSTVIANNLIFYNGCRFDIPVFSAGGGLYINASQGAVYLTRSVVAGGATAAGASLFYHRGGDPSGLTELSNTTFKPGPSFIGMIWDWVFGYQDYETTGLGVLLLGNGACDGIRILAHGAPVSLREDNWIKIRDCLTAVSIVRSRLQSSAFDASKFSGNVTNLSISDSDVDINTAVVTAGGTPTTALSLDGTAYTPAQITALGLAAGDSITGVRGSLLRLK